MKNNHIFSYFSIDFDQLIIAMNKIKQQRTRWKHFVHHWQESGVLILSESKGEIKRKISEFIKSNPDDLLDQFLSDLDTLPVIQNRDTAIGRIDFHNWENYELGTVKPSVLLPKGTDQVKHFLHVVKPAMESFHTVQIIDNYVFSHSSFEKRITHRMFEFINQFPNIKLIEIAAMSGNREFLTRDRIEQFIIDSEIDRTKIKLHLSDSVTSEFHDRAWSFVNNNLDGGFSIQVGRGIAMFGESYHPTVVSKISRDDFNKMWECVKVEDDNDLE